MKKVSELTGAELDYWVAKAQGCERVRLNLKGEYGNRTVYVDHVDVAGVGLFKPSSSWAQGGPIIEREKIAVCYDHLNEKWLAVIFGNPLIQTEGNTPLIAAMRCYVASVYGDTVSS